MPETTWPSEADLPTIEARELWLREEVTDLTEDLRFVRLLARCEPWAGASRALAVARRLRGAVEPLAEAIQLTPGELESIQTSGRPGPRREPPWNSVLRAIETLHARVTSMSIMAKVKELPDGRVELRICGPLGEAIELSERRLAALGQLRGGEPGEREGRRLGCLLFLAWLGGRG